MANDLELSAQTVGDIKTPAETLLQRIAASAEVPRRFRRIAARSNKWDIPRSFIGYRADPTIQTLGYAPKWVLVSDSGGPEFILKLPYKGGLTETLTELLINQLGTAWGFDMAHSGLASMDGRPAFVTRSFLTPTDHLVHGSFLIEELFHTQHGELDAVPKGHKEQEFYSVDFVVKTIEEYCGASATQVINKFVEMLLFDAMIGSTDRHAQNWGVIRSSTTQGGYRFSPIFDTSRGLFWNLPDDKLLPIQRDDNLLRFHIDRACPVMGPEFKALKTKKCNHIQFLCSLFTLFPHLTVTAVTKVPCDLKRTAASIINSFPFCGAFSKLRRDTILKLLLRRADMVSQVLEAGGGG